MKILLFVLVGSFCFAGCTTKKEMNLDDLVKTSLWKELHAGVNYISIEEYAPDTSRTIRYKVMGLEKDGYVGRIDSAETLIPGAEAYAGLLLDPVLNDKLPGSKRGYMKVNFNKMLANDNPVRMIIFLEDNYDSATMIKDMEMIRGTYGIKEAGFMSKEMAREKYLSDGNDTWDKVLDDNPLPASIEVAIDISKLKSADIDKLEQKLKTEVHSVTEINTSGLREENSEKYIYLEYNRVK